MINLQTYRNSSLELPVTVALDRQDLTVKLYLSSYSSTSKDNFLGSKMSTVTSAEYQMNKQFSIGSKYTYGVVLSELDLPNDGIYTGYISAVDANIPTNVVQKPIFEDQVQVSVLENPLHQLSNTGSPDGYLTYAQLIEQLYVNNLRMPYPIQQRDKKTGKIVYELFDGIILPIVMKDNKGNRLQDGAYARVYDANTGVQVPVFNQLDIQLVLTNPDGSLKGFANSDPIPGAYNGSVLLVGGIARGKYYAAAYYNNKRITQPIFFEYPPNNA
jgi:hypothetical protein